MTTVDGLMLIAAAGVALLAATVLVECLAALWPMRRLVDREAVETIPPLAVLIPAHNEGRNVMPTVRSVAAQLRPEDRLIVVADNCTDDTATAAAQAGAKVIERSDAERRGKGYALAFGVDYLRANPPGVVVILDADCFVDEGTVVDLAQVAAKTGRPVQACYVMKRPREAGPRDTVSALAFLMKNAVRARGLSVLGGTCHLTGSGMALPWELVSRMSLASGHIVEDMAMGVDAAAMGRAPVWCGQVWVVSELPDQASAATSQRTRWEHGHLQVLQRAPGYLMKGLATGRWALAAMAIDLMVPPLSLLVMLMVAVTGAATVWGWMGGSWAAAVVAGSSLAAVGLSVMIGWAMAGRREISLMDLASVPLYVLWKIPIYLKFFTKRQSSWVRTDRSKGGPMGAGDASVPTQGSGGAMRTESSAEQRR
jgi:cellulose synthase/poly-beta-1,6-N-acetylglucosamine synthase-like glycosyltransferase